MPDDSPSDSGGPPVGPLRRWYARATLRRLRASVRGRTYRRIWFLTAVAYVIVSLFLGQMLIVLAPSPAASTLPVSVTWVGPGEVSNPYLAPALLVVSPYVVLALPYWGTLIMVLLGAGIGLAAASGVATFVEQRRRSAALAAGGAAPAVTGWAFLGACCCTTCGAQVAATGVVGAAVGATPSSLIAEAWPLALLQLFVVALSLLYLEYRMEMPGRPVSVPSPGRLVGAVGLRILLLIAAVTWLFALAVEATQGATLSGATVYHWGLEHVALGTAALLSALVPVWALAGLGRRGPARAVARGLLLLAGITWGVGVPPVAAQAGLGGTLNEVLGYLGVPPAWGGVPPDGGLGAALLFHWGFQHVLLGAWAILLAVRPVATSRWLSAGEPDPLATRAAATEAVPSLPALRVEARGDSDGPGEPTHTL